MKIKITNIGPIHKFEIDLSKKLTMIYGKNNIGKSYAISVVYMFLKSLPMMTKKNELESSIQKYTSNMRVSHSGKLKGNSNINSEELHGIVNAVFGSILGSLIPEKLTLLLKSSYGTLLNVKNIRSAEPGIISISTKPLSFRFVLWKNLDSGGIVEITSNTEYFKSKNYSVENIESICYSILKDFFRHIRLFITSFYYIPAVRSGIYLGLSNLGSIIAKINQYQGVIGAQSFTLPNTTVPVSDFYSTISNKLAFASADEYNYKSVIDQIEQDILKGTVQIDKESGRILYFSHELQRTFDLSQVSSMVSELSIIIAYFKYIIWDHVSIDNFDGQESLTFGVFPTLFIEEPEAHLHPEAQIKLMQLLVELAKIGVHLVITSHSDFMLNSLGNQLLAGNIKSRQIGSILLSKTEKGSIILKQMNAGSAGIRDYNFYEATDTLYRERIRLNEENNYRLSRKNKRL